VTRALITLDALAAEGLIADARDPALVAVAARYAIAVTPAMRERIATPDDPIARQFIPSPAELTTRPEESPDPIGDHPHSPVKGLVHRYPDRVLIKVTHTCPVYCRFCFRREIRACRWSRRSGSPRRWFPRCAFPVRRITSHCTPTMCRNSRKRAAPRWHALPMPASHCWDRRCCCAASTYVLDLPGGHGKVPINGNYLRDLPSGEVEIRDPAGIWHRYPG